ncbi:MAG: OsmC family protein [Tranquillimonas sp.]
MIRNSGSAKWSGGLQDGEGQVSTGSGVLSDVPYSFKKRFEGEPGSNPEELIGAAHAACFSMALSMILEQKDMTPEEIATKATVTLDKQDDGFAITKVHLDVTARIPGADAHAFEEVAQAAKQGCPVSKVLNAEISMDARLA